MSEKNSNTFQVNLIPDGHAARIVLQAKMWDAMDTIRNANFLNLEEQPLGNSFVARLTRAGKSIQLAESPESPEAAIKTMENIAALYHHGVVGEENGIALIKTDQLPAETKKGAIVAFATPQLEVALSTCGFKYAKDVNFRDTGKSVVLLFGNHAQRLQDMNRGCIHN